MNYTKGPWSILPDHNPGIEAADYSVIIIGFEGEESGVQGRTAEEKYANARLIAAAPELLELLIESQSSIGGDWRARRDSLILKATSDPKDKT